MYTRTVEAQGKREKPELIYHYIHSLFLIALAL